MRLGIAVLILCFGLPVFAEMPVSFGVKGGILLSDSTVGYSHNEDRWYTVGPTIEARLPWSLGVEFNPLYKRLGFSNSSTDILGSFYHLRARYNVWEFPVLGKYYRGPFFASGGYTARRRSHDDSIQYSELRNTNGTVYSTTTGPINLDTTTDHGFAVGGGARFPIFGRLKLSGEYRYSRWVSIDQFEHRGLVTGPNKNQHEILVGFTF